MKILGAIIAGGRATRFDGDKGAALLDGKALIDHVVDGLSAHCTALSSIRGNKSDRCIARLALFTCTSEPDHASPTRTQTPLSRRRGRCGCAARAREGAREGRSQGGKAPLIFRRGDHHSRRFKLLTGVVLYFKAQIRF